MARTVADMTPDEFSDSIANSFAKVNGMTRGTGGSYTGGSGGAAASGVPSWFSAGTTGMSNAMGAAGKLATGLYGVNDALGTVKQLGSAFGPVTGAVAGMGTQVAEAGLAVNRSLNTVAQSGIHMGQNLGLYDKAVLEARMSLPEFEQTIKQNSKSIAGMGANMDKSALIYLETAKQIQNTDVAYQLKATGTNTEEFGQILTLVAHNSRQDNLMSATAQKQLIATSLALATEMDNTARLTGISRQEQQLALEKQLKSKDMQLAMAAMDAEQRDSVEKSLAGTLKYGENVQNAIRIYATGGVTNEQEQQQVLAAGPLAKYAEELANITGNTAEDEAHRREVYKKMDQETLAEARSSKESKMEWTAQMKAGSETTKAMAGGVLERLRYGQILADADNDAKRKGLTREQYIAQEEEKLKKEREGAAAGTGGPEGEAAKLGQTLNKVDTALKDVAAGAGTYFSNLNTKAGELITSFGNLNGVLKRYTPEQVAGLVPAMADKAKTAMGTREASVPESEKKKAGREFGSLGSVGKLIEDFGAGTDMTLHGKEGVITESQLKGIIGTAQKMGSDIGKNINVGKKVDPTDLELPNMFKSMKDTMNMMLTTGGPTSQAEAEKMAKSMQIMGKQMSSQMGPMISSIQGNLKSDLEKAKSQMPTTSTFEKMFEKIKPATAPQPMPEPAAFAPDNESNDPMTDMVKGVNELNKRIERLIMAVEDGHDKSVRAIKNTGNLIA